MAKRKNKAPLMLRIVRWWFPKLEALAPPLATRLFVQLFFTPLHYGLPEKEKEWIDKAKGFKLLVNGKEVQCYSWGDENKPIVLFIHGWAGRGTQFRKFFPFFLNAGYQVVAFDGPAHGQSSGKRTNLPEFGDTLKLLFEKIGEPKAVIAHSFGGVAAMFAIMNGLPIKKLVNIGTPAIADLIIQTFLKAVNGSQKTAEHFKEYMVKKYGRSFQAFSIQYFIPRIKEHPKLMLVHDEEDADVSLEHPLEVLRLYPDAWFLKTKGLGHTQILKDDSVIKDILKFVRTDG